MIHEECAVFGVNVKSSEAAGIVYNGLLALQHRGQEGAGIAVADKNCIRCHKDVGLLNEVFNRHILDEGLPKTGIAIGHNRYSTTGTNVKENVQPFITEYLKGRIATAHNGNITNAKSIKDTLIKEGIAFSSTSDSEVVSALIAYNIMKFENVYKGIAEAVNQIEGSFSIIILTSEHQLIAVRDSRGFRPLCIGKNEDGYAISSESCALDSCGFEFLRDVNPGEMVVIENGNITQNEIIKPKKNGICIFEYVYFARTDSIIDNQSVYKARYRTGEILARECPAEADAVCGVPDGGLEAAMGYAKASGMELISGFAKNRYIGRSFIFPTQKQRESAVRLKLNPQQICVKGKRIILIDDSIVRGTTCGCIVSALKEAGAKEVHLRISSPPFKHTCHFGTDIDSEDKLIANRMELDAICKKLGADSIGYISIEGLKEACSDCRLDFCTRCFTGYEDDRFDKIRKGELEE